MDNSQLLVSVFAIALSSISLIVTVIGWSITARRQKELLERQISAERDKARLGFSIPRYIKMIDDVREWKLEGDRIDVDARTNKLTGTRKQKIIQSIGQWREKFYFQGISEKIMLINEENKQSDLYLLADKYMDVTSKIVQKTILGQHLDNLITEAERLDATITADLLDLEKKFLGK